MQADLMKQWSEINQNIVNSMKKLGEINTQVMQKMTERQIAVMNAYMEGVSKQLEAMKDAKSSQDMMALQAQLAKEFNEKVMENAQETMDLLVQTRTDLTSWVEKGMEAAASAANEKK